MPLREFGCTCGAYKEIYHPAINPEDVPAPVCCGGDMSMLWSTPNLDTSSTFKPFDYKGPDGRAFHIDNLHALRAVEHSYLATGHNVRFDAYSAEPSNPDTIDGFGQEYWDGSPSYSTGKIISMPTMGDK